MTKTQRKEAYNRLQRNSSRFVIDKNVGICTAQPWGVRKSAGFDTQQIITEIRPSKLQQRSASYKACDHVALDDTCPMLEAFVRKIANG